MIGNDLIILIIGGAALIIAAINLYFWWSLKSSLGRLFEETGHDQFGEVLLYHQKQHQTASDNFKKLSIRIAELEDESQLLLNQVGLVRFNPFSNTGGNMSFSLALLNANGDGAVITSLHSREGIRFYAKEVKNYESEQILTDEEKEAVEKAKRSNSQK